LHIVLVHVLSTHSATDRSANNQQNQDCGDYKECAYFHAKDDSRSLIVGITLAGVSRVMMPNIVDGILVGGR
jgi:hypothetical protein